MFFFSVKGINIFLQSERGIEGEIENKMAFSLTSHTVGRYDYVHLEFYVQSIPILMKVRCHLKHLLVRIILNRSGSLLSTFPHVRK